MGGLPNPSDDRLHACRRNRRAFPDVAHQSGIVLSFLAGDILFRRRVQLFAIDPWGDLHRPPIREDADHGVVLFKPYPHGFRIS
ncbi:hypothetical protein IGS68_24240 [Skermanella sp. TT6]|uniref:Uncharacterized protein n=2 Tax=Skermanella cutis TaxID=2775420 RepID=A0ABX7B406_9PROT|nr:hypothetical protein IGS68_24240 [Skermanella sp. TT6]